MQTLYQTLFVSVFLFVSSTSLHAQNFFTDFNTFMNHSEAGRNKLYQKQMKAALKEYTERTTIDITNCDSLFIVNYAMPISFKQRCIIWNKKYSLLYDYGLGIKGSSSASTLKVDCNALAVIKRFRPDFRLWVETADTARYTAYGRTAVYIDGPFVSFTFAQKVKGHWKFINSKGYSSQTDTINK